MDASEFDFKNFSLSDSIFVFEEYPITSVSVRIRKEKVTSETMCYRHKLTGRNQDGLKAKDEEGL